MSLHTRTDSSLLCAASLSKSRSESDAESGTEPTAPDAAPDSKTESQSNGYFPIVGVAASAGGLDAFKKFFRHMPSDSGMAFVLVQHLDPNHKSLMAELLQTGTQMEVVQAEDHTRLEPNHVYVIAPDTYLRVEDETLQVEPLEQRPGIRMAADELFRSLAEDQRERAVCVVLTGTGSDGTAGLKSVKAHGGLTIVQDPETAQYDGMPRSAVEAGVVDFVVSIDEIPDILQRYAEHPYLRNTGEVSAGHAEDSDAFESILAELTSRSSIDFSAYRSSTVRRRIERRMSFNQVADLADYEKFLRNDGDEAEQLAGDLMIGVTRFFRDPELWQTVREKVITPMMGKEPAGEPIRCWVPACSSGEEAYTVAMLVQSVVDESTESRDVTIFASDIDGNALKTARAGRYPASIVSDVPEEYRKRYFSDLGDDSFEVAKRLREKVVFAKQNLIADPPFSRLDFISCRNFLIYLRRETQALLLARFHFALKTRGYLFLGNSESVSGDADFWSQISKPARIFQRLQVSPERRTELYLARERRAGRAVGSDGGRDGKATERRPVVNQVEDRIRREMLVALTPPTLVVNGEGKCVYVSGDVDRFVQFPRGTPDLQLAAILRPGLIARVRSAMRTALEEQKTVWLEGVNLQDENDPVTVDLQVSPTTIDEDGQQLAIVAFRDVRESPNADLTRSESLLADDLVKHLDRELKATQEDLQSTIEELETSNEELKASNEEVMSINEELQSTNEELETSKEELQSLNEELNTVNKELRLKVGELQSVNNDMVNLLNSTDMATLFLDDGLRVKRFTPATRELYNLIEADRGRPLSDLSAKFDDDQLLRDAVHAQHTGESVQRRIAAEDDRYYVRRALPYRESDGSIDGVVVTFSDVSELANSERTSRTRLAELEAIYEHSPIGIGYHDTGLRMRRVNARLAEINGVSAEDSLGQRPSEFLGEAFGRDVEKVLEEVIRSGRPNTEVEWQAVLPGDGSGALRDYRASYYPMHDDSGGVHGVTVLVEDVTRAKLGERRLKIERAVAQVFAGAENYGELIEGTLAALASSFGGGIGEYWERKDDEGHLVCTHFRATLGGIDEQQLKNYFDNVTLAVGESVIGEVWLKREPKWYSDVSAYPHFQRREQAIQLGLRAALCFPVIYAGDVVGLGAIFTQQPYPLDPQMLALLSALGRDLATQRDRLIQKDRLRESQATVRQSLRQLRSVYRIAPVGLISCAPDLTVQSCNRSLSRFSSGAIKAGVELAAIDDDTFAGRLSAVVREALHAGESIVEREFELGDQLAERRHFLSRAVRMKPSDRTDDSVVAVVSDITQVKRAETEMREAERHRNAFLATLGHELRNPMAAVSSTVELLKADESTVNRATRVITDNVKIVRRLLDDLLDLTRVEKGKLELQRERVDIGSVVSRALSTVKGTAAERDIAVTYSHPEPPVYAWADGDRVEQIVWNLLSNAVKFSPSGGTIDVRLSADQREARVRVQDSGPGIAQDDQERVFAPFEQGSRGTALQEGLGIGLPLARQLAELHGGTLVLESAGHGHGCAFTLVLPRGTEEQLAGGPESPSADMVQSDLSHLTVAIVDDNKVSADALSRLLELKGASSFAYHDGATLLSRLDSPPLDAVILDLSLPGMDGYQVAVELRERGFSGRLIAVTGYGHREARQKTTDAGFDHHLNKPVDMRELIEALAADR